MTYVINPSVNIGGVDYSGDTLNGVQATAGRTNVDEQPRAGYASISVIENDTATVGIEIDDKVVVQVDDSNGTPITLWTGWVSDVVKTLRNYGNRGYVTETKVTAIGSLAKLNRRRVGAGGYAKQFDGDRIYDILFETAGITWADVNATEQWEDVNPLQNWATYDILIGTIDTPGDFELTAYSAGEANGLTLAQTMAQSGAGILYEGADGKISYDDFTSRLDRVAVEGFTQLDLGDILSTNLTSVSRLADLVNNVEVAYKNNQTESDTEATSIALYGDWVIKVQTQLENQVDAAQRVEYYLATRAFPRTSLTQISLVLSAGMDNQMIDDLLGLTISLPIAISGLPPNIYSTNFSGFVEGYTWTISQNELFLTLNVSDYALSQLEMNWLQVPASELWNTITPTLTWENARSVY